MRPDDELITLILTTLEAHEGSDFDRNLPWANHDNELVHGHLELLRMRRYITGKATKGAYGAAYPQIISPRLTALGRERLAQLRR